MFFTQLRPFRLLLLAATLLIAACTAPAESAIPKKHESWGDRRIFYRQLTHLQAKDVSDAINHPLIQPGPYQPHPIADFDARTNSVVVVNGPFEELLIEAIDQWESQAAADPAPVLRFAIDYLTLTHTSATDLATRLNSQFAASRQSIAPGAHFLAQSAPDSNSVVLSGPPQLVRQAHNILVKSETDAAGTAAAPKLAGAALAKALDDRFGIWFLGPQIPPSVSMILPVNASYREAIGMLFRTFDLQPFLDLRAIAGFRDDTILQIISAGTEPTELRFGTDPTNIPFADDPATQIIPLYNEPLADFLQTFKPMFGPNATITHLNAHHCIMITDTSDRIHCLVEAVVIARRPRVQGTMIEHHHLSKRNASDVARELTEYFAAPPSTSKIPESNPAPHLYSDPDSRTNTIVLNGPPELVTQAMDLINQLESNTPLLKKPPAPSPQ